MCERRHSPLRLSLWERPAVGRVRVHGHPAEGMTLGEPAGSCPAGGRRPSGGRQAAEPTRETRSAVRDRRYRGDRPPGWPLRSATAPRQRLRGHAWAAAREASASCLASLRRPPPALDGPPSGRPIHGLRSCRRPRRVAWIDASSIRHAAAAPRRPRSPGGATVRPAGRTLAATTPGQACRGHGWPGRRYLLTRKWQMSPSRITYSLPSTRSLPAARISFSLL